MDDQGVIRPLFWPIVVRDRLEPTGQESPLAPHLHVHVPRLHLEFHRPHFPHLHRPLLH